MPEGSSPLPALLISPIHAFCGGRRSWWVLFLLFFLCFAVGLLLLSVGHTPSASPIVFSLFSVYACLAGFPLLSRDCAMWWMWWGR
jgi:hypothetical protein